MNIIVVHPKVTSKSAKRLANELGVLCYNMANLTAIQLQDIKNADLVFNYGSSSTLLHNAKAIINKPSSISKCVDKRQTFDTLLQAGISTCRYVTKSTDIPVWWNTIVYREDSCGNRAKGLDYFNQGDKMPDEGLFTEYFKSEFEMRIMVYRGKIIGRYIKEEHNGVWDFVEASSAGLQTMDTQCKVAAQLLDIDFVGFDVLAKDCEDFRILEANSGCTMTDEALTHIVKAIKEMK